MCEQITSIQNNMRNADTDAIIELYYPLFLCLKDDSKNEHKYVYLHINTANENPSLGRILGSKGNPYVFQFLFPK
jgi:hypothetical protein